MARPKAELRADGHVDVLRLFEERPLVHVAAPMVRYSKYERECEGGA